MTSDWNDPKLRKIGERFAADAYNLALTLELYGADASVLLLPEAERMRVCVERPPHVNLPTFFADEIMAILLSLPRRYQHGRRRNWSPHLVQASLNSGMSLRAAAKKESERSGKPAVDIERAVRLSRAKKAKGRPKKKTPR
jgi:hypothetical protein